jgi:hypothetical protein
MEEIGRTENQKKWNNNIMRTEQKNANLTTEKKKRLRLEIAFLREFERNGTDGFKVNCLRNRICDERAF